MRIKYNGVFVDEMGPTQLAAYREHQERCKSRLEEMLASGRTPRIKTSNTFIAMGKTGGAQFGDATREYYLRMAREAGVGTDGKVYDGRLAEYPADPRAWITSTDDTRAIMEERGWGCDGDVKVEGRVPDKVPSPGLAPELVEDLVEQRFADKYGDDLDGLAVPKKEFERVKEDVINQHSPPPHWKTT